MQSTKQAIFKLGDEEYGLEIVYVNAVEQFLELEPMIDAPQNVMGLIRLRGNMVPVYSLRKKFGLQEKEVDDETRLLISKVNGITVAYEVDIMQEIIEFEPEQLYNIPEVVQGSNTAYLKYVAKKDSKIILLLDHSKLISEDELSKLQDLNK